MRLLRTKPNDDFPVVTKKKPHQLMRLQRTEPNDDFAMHYSKIQGLTGNRQV